MNVEVRKVRLIYLIMFTATILIALLTFALLNVASKRYSDGYQKGQDDLLESIESQALKTDKYIFETGNLIYTLDLNNSATVTKP